MGLGVSCMTPDVCPPQHYDRLMDYKIYIFLCQTIRVDGADPSDPRKKGIICMNQTLHSVMTLMVQPVSLMFPVMKLPQQSLHWPTALIVICNQDFHFCLCDQISHAHTDWLNIFLFCRCPRRRAPKSSRGAGGLGDISFWCPLNDYFMHVAEENLNAALKCNRMYGMVGVP